MMTISVNPSHFKKTMPLEDIVPLLAKNGFTAVDYTPPYKLDNCEEQTAADAALFAKYGITVGQSNAPFNRYGSHGDIETHTKRLYRCLDACKICGTKYLVVHGDEFDFANKTYTPESALAYNYELFAPYVERAEKLGIGIAFENVFTDWDRPRFCSEFDELESLITKFNSPNVTCCWDTGHAMVAFKERQPEMIRKMGSRITCTHVHDNSHNTDLHQVPFHGDIDWKAVMKAFEDAGYAGNLSYELVYGAIAPELVDITLRLLADTAKLLDAYRKA